MAGNPCGTGEIEVEDAALIATRVDQVGEDWVFQTNIETQITLNVAHPFRLVVDSQTGEPRPYVGAERGLEARLRRPVYYELVEAATEQA